MDFEGERDPDYEEIHVNQQNHLSVIKNDVKEATIKRIQTIINNEFNKEIEIKENELDLIHKNLQEAHYALDQLRTSIITKFYLGEQINTDTQFSNRSEQSWIHPTTKQYLGKAPSGTDIPAASIQEHDYSTPLRISSTDVESAKENTVNETKNEDETSTSNLQRVKKTLKIVVGNISKYIPPIEQSHNDQTTHKWMVYFRLKNEKFDVKRIVKKVIIFLHPSYKPNDLVELREPPFYLCRRGWGEFPVRVQVHFRDTQNKPFDIIHNLKLDKTFTGLQTMGGETVEDVSLYLNESVPSTTSKAASASFNVNSAAVAASKKPSNAPVINGNIKIEPNISNQESLMCPSNSSIVKVEPVDETQTSKSTIESNLYLGLKMEPDIEETNNSSLPSKKLKSILLPKTTAQTGTISLLKKNAQNAYNIVIVQPNATSSEVKYFLCSNNSTPCLSKPVSLLSKSSVQNVKVKKERTESTTINGCTFWQNAERVHRLLVKGRFSLCLANYDSMHEFLVDLVKYFPLCCSSPSYPFCASSYENFNSWNIGKQRASEWLRARTIGRILQDLFKDSGFPWAKVIWNTKEILMWCRASGFIPPFYSPVISNCLIVQTDRKNSESTIINAVNLVMELEEKKHCPSLQEKDTVEEDVDVEIVEDICPKNSRLKRTHMESDYIKELFLSKPVEEPDIIEEIYSVVCKEFISDIIHCSMFEGAKSQQSKLNPNHVSIENVYKAILNNSKFDILTNKYLGIEYESN